MKKTTFILILLVSIVSHAQREKPNFSQIDTVIKTLYKVISGPPGERDWNLFQSLFHEKAIMGNTGLNQEGKRAFVYFTPEGYVERNDPYFKRQGFFEEELERITNQYGGIAQVFTAYQFRFEEEGQVVQRGINSIQLIFKDERWYITQLVWEAESKETPLPKLK